MAESNWRWCVNCRSLFLGDNLGTCPAGGQHDPTSSPNYRLQTGPGGVGQPLWRRCGRCSGLFYLSLFGSGWCPAGGGHDAAGSADYSLLVGVFPAPYQSGWYWCPRCGGLPYLGTYVGATSTSGWCPAGGGHQRTTGDTYSVENLDY